MTDITDTVTRTLRTGMPLQFEVDDTDARHPASDTIRETCPDPVLTVDAGTVTSFKEFVEQLATHTAQYDPESPQTTQTMWWAVEDTIQEHGSGTLYLKHFDALPGDTAQTVAQRVKGLYESTDAVIIMTATDTGALFEANPDLRGRIKTVKRTDS